MYTANPQSVLINATVATLLNLTTTTKTDFQNFGSNATTLNPLYNSSDWNSTQWYPWFNNSIWNPNPITVAYCPSCYPQFVTDPPPLVSYTYTYLYFVLLLLPLFILAIFLKARQKQAQIRAAAVQCRTARQQAEISYGSTQNSNTSNNENICHMAPKEIDCPPAYNEVMQSYLMAKQQQQPSHGNDANEGAVGFTTDITSSENNLSTTAISTLTIDTDVSALDLYSPAISSMTTAATATAAVVVNLQPPSYEASIEMANTKINNDHIV